MCVDRMPFSLLVLQGKGQESALPLILKKWQQMHLHRLTVSALCSQMVMFPDRPDTLPQPGERPSQGCGTCTLPSPGVQALVRWPWPWTWVLDTYQSTLPPWSWPECAGPSPLPPDVALELKFLLYLLTSGLLLNVSSFLAVSIFSLRCSLNFFPACSSWTLVRVQGWWEGAMWPWGLRTDLASFKI